MSTEAPVNEVVLSIQFESTDQLVAPRMPQLLGAWYQSHPNISTAPRYEMPPEARSSTASGASRLAPRIEVMGPGDMDVRYWFESPDKVFVVQFQKDYLALNWRRGNAPYVKYEELRERFLDLMETVSNNLSEIGSGLAPTRAEMSYINIVRPGTLWRGPADLHSLLAFSFWDEDVYDELALSYAKPLLIDGEWAGRIHAAIQPGYDWLKEEPALSMNLTARSGTLEKQEIAEALQFLDSAHSSLNGTFDKMVRPDVRATWGGINDSHE